MFRSTPPSAELDALPRDGTCNKQDGGDAMVSAKYLLAAKKIFTTDCCDREIQQLDRLPQIPHQVHPTPSDRLPLEIATAQNHHRQQYVSEQAVRTYAWRAKPKRIAALESVYGGDWYSLQGFRSCDPTP